MKYGYLDKEVKALVAERDRLAAENAELKALCIDNTISVLQDRLSAESAAYASLLESHEIILDALTESDATLDRLREVVPEGNWIYACSEIRLLRVVVAVRKLLYPKETDNGD